MNPLKYLTLKYDNEDSLAYRQIEDYIKDELGDSSDSGLISFLFFLIHASRPNADMIVIEKKAIPSEFIFLVNAWISKYDFLYVYEGEKCLDGLIRISSNYKEGTLSIIGFKWSSTYQNFVSRVTRSEVFFYQFGYGSIPVPLPLHKFKLYTLKNYVLIYDLTEKQVLKKCGVFLEKESFDKVHIIGKENNISCMTNNIRRSSLIITGNNNHVYIGENVKIDHGRIKISGNGCSIIIQDNTTVIGKLDIAGNSSHISIGRNVIFTNLNTRLFAQEDNISITIGHDCLIGECIMRTSDSHSIIDRNTNIRINLPESIDIGDRVWIAQDVKILKGVEIANEVVIEAGSTVVKPITQNYSIHAGNPAKLIKENVIWNAKKL